ncbi:MAG TPA: maleylpyruvate isomerase N-terminal domain-containing protein [Streptosporangiaceae bacterium]|nr:maleylpyruvate isomerase N-terminal domain-containing protein [Streptosporangiaceae bacterium]
MPIPAFTDLLKLIEDRSAALRTAAGLAGPDARVPGCPDWSVRDLVAHLGEVQRFWAAVVAAGPAASPPAEDQIHDLEPDNDLIGWSADWTGELVRALAEAGPGRPCWTWWPESGAPADSGAVARHQVQEAAVHAFDAQEAAGRAEPLPADVAADGLGEFLTVGMATMGGWPHEAGRVALTADGGPAWLVDLGPSGARAQEDEVPGTGQAVPGARVRGSASDLVLALYGRQPRGSLDIEGDQELATRLLSWTDNE